MVEAGLLPEAPENPNPTPRGNRQEMMMMDEVQYIKSAIWQPTMELRWFRPLKTTTAGAVLQQLWTSNKGEHEWRNISIAVGDDDG